MLVQVVERRCSVGPIEHLPVPLGLHAAADDAQQLLPLLVQLEGLFVQLSPPPLQRVALSYRRLPPVVRAHLGGLSDDEIRFYFTHEIGVHLLLFILIPWHKRSHSSTSECCHLVTETTTTIIVCPTVWMQIDWC